MLSGTPDALDMVQIKNELAMHVPDDLKQYVEDDDTVTEITYPVKEYPQKVKSVKLSEKTPVVEGVLKGIKGQYLLLDQDRVLMYVRMRDLLLIFHLLVKGYSQNFFRILVLRQISNGISYGCMPWLNIVLGCQSWPSTP